MRATRVDCFPSVAGTAVAWQDGYWALFPHDRDGEGVMNRNVGIWIDHKRAVIVLVSAEGITTRTVESNVAAHPRYGGQQDGGGEQKYEARHGQSLDRYYDDVIGQLVKPDALFVFGPGEAKLELMERLGRSTERPQCPVEVETTDKLTDPQIAAKVKDHFGLDRGASV
jgi:hypothetical protein